MIVKRKMLYVEDWSRSVERMLPAIREEFNVRIAGDLNEGLSLLNRNTEENFDCVLIDALFRCHIPQPLLDYVEKSTVKKKQAPGQLLGAWMAEHVSNIPYAYITLVPPSIILAYEKDHKNFRGIIDKESNEALARNINATIRRLFDF
jgi:hypothetical protein